MRKLILLNIVSFFCVGHIYGQLISGTIRSGSNKPVGYATVFLKNTKVVTQTNEQGQFRLDNAPKGDQILCVTLIGYKTICKPISIKNKSLRMDLKLEFSEEELKQLDIEIKDDNTHGISRLNEVEGTAIYAGKKNEVVMLNDITANTSANNARQIFSKVAGLNIWENDGAGIQLGIAARGLNPSRTSGFNTRLNGYDMSADAIGYPESYYTPPSEALERIEVIRGAASLQYGTQFGGVLNFIKKKGNDTVPFEVVSRQTAGSFGFFNSFNSFGGTTGKINYYSYVQHKQGNGWRENSDFDLNSAYASVGYKVNEKLEIRTDLTLMKYLAQQPGGLTDYMFEQDPRQSIRDRNWFKVTWNLVGVNVDYAISENTKLNSRTFGLLASREAMGYLGQINRTDPLQERDLLSDHYKNWGNETRVLHTYNLGNQKSNVVFGFRFYKGHLDRKQGLTSIGNDPDFEFLNESDLEGSDFIFPSKNFALFTENIFRLTNRLSVTPGARLEFISTQSDGYFNQFYTDLAGNILEFTKVSESDSRSRLFPLFGLGIGYYLTERVELYGNISQNFRAITFNDMRVNNPSLVVDRNLEDEKGYNADLGIRGKIGKALNFDATLFYLSYNKRIGTIQQVDPEKYRTYRFRTNIGDSRTYGIESFAELDLLRLKRGTYSSENSNSLTIFSNVSILNAVYIDNQEEAFNGNKVELVPNLIMKYGASYKTQKGFSISYNISYTSIQYTDATNAEFTPNAVNGLVPAYYVMDISFKQSIRKRWQIEGGVHNLTNNMYFTRRADGYPGPGIIPSDGRNFYVTLQVRL